MSAPRRESIVVLLMGVAGSGKTTIGEKLAAELGWPFRDADEFHPPANVAKMSRGEPLTDADRQPWLAAIHDYITRQLAASAPAVVTCSALRASYRAAVMADPMRVKLVYLAGSYPEILARLQRRTGHFMKPAMLESQFATLEPPEHALTLDIAAPPESIVRQIRAALAL